MSHRSTPSPVLPETRPPDRRAPGATAFLALIGLCAPLHLVACGQPPEELSFGGGSATDGSSATVTGRGSTSAQGEGPDDDTEADGSGETAAETEGSGGSTSSTTSHQGSTDGSTSGEEGSTSGGFSFPIDCDDEGLPVHVDGGGSYATIAEGVFATPPDGTLWVCPGGYTEALPVVIEDPISIIGAGADLVHFDSAADFVPMQAVGGAFEVVSSGITLEGMTIDGGRYGLIVTLNQGSGHTIAVRDVHFTNAGFLGIQVGFGAIELDGVTATFEQVVVDNVDSSGRAAVWIRDIETAFVDTIIRDNTTQFGGLYLENAPTTFEGGRVVQNTASDARGGGAFIESKLPQSELVITDSDWGEGADMDNAPNDVGCGSDLVGWLGTPISTTCSNGINGCCTVE